MTETDLPKGWSVVRLDSVASIQTGLAKGKQGLKDPLTLPYLRVANVQDGYLDLADIKEIQVERAEVERYRLQKGDVLLTEGGDNDKLGRGDVWQGQIPICLHQNHIFAVRTQREVLEPYFLSALAGSSYGKLYFRRCSKQSTNLATINSTQLKEFPVILPPKNEQLAIVQCLRTWDEAIAQTGRRIAAGQQRKQGLMQRLLTGRVRFPEFIRSVGITETPYGDLPADWQYVPIAQIATEIGARNIEGRDYPVLSCTKHYGLVDSLEYFGRQMFSDDTSTYKVVKRGQFAYATNHIEEGSIGLQSLHDVALISPMYTVFETGDEVDADFLYRVFKTEKYRRIFETSTNGTVNRRGSLRWKEFSQIRVPLPSLPEQRRIAEALAACDRELDLLARKRDALQRQKRGLMQQLLTGRVRVKA